MTVSPTLRWFWRIYVPVATLAILGIPSLSLGPAVETRFWPVRGPQSVEVIERTPSRLCWAWTFVKLRNVSSPDLDAEIEINGEFGGVVSVFDMDSGRPWGMAKYAVPPRPEPYVLRMCTALPPYIKPSDEVRVRQVAYYPGVGPWRLPVPFPPVVSDPAPPP